MNKSDLVDAVAAATNEGKTKVATLLDTALSHISEALRNGDKVTLPGFGTFDTRKRQARSGRNPRTGAPVKIAATTAPVFKAGATLKESVAGKKTTGKAAAKSKAKASAKGAVKAKAASKAPAKTAAKSPAKVAAKPAAKATAAAKLKASPKETVKSAGKAVAKAPAKAAPKAPAKPKASAKKK